ncbi:hypothetical protein [Caballeronia sp. LZ032]|uniref:hypothetical protein n=1 Tax=Caballeronia sp. LZ032 TaxID=3038565 RepID=UPI00286317CD|nr:hypothetical protein [Caballeronia sp. LZ032]MDR5883593.1 hypothetical protein [Caballeronia sp. LZ032]
MSITKRPATPSAAALREFINRAPDAASGDEPARGARRKKETISLGIDPVLLQRIDERAVELGISRAAAIAIALAKYVEAEK